MSSISNVFNYNNLPIVDLKKICKINKIKNYSKLKKVDIIKKIIDYFSVLKIQKFWRKKLINNKLCPISLNVIKYPCYAFKTKKGNFIYYNIKPLIDYLITTGNFQDPKTRQTYSEDNIKTIENIRKYYKLPGKNIIKVSRNKRYYMNKRDIEDDILVIERTLDSIIFQITKLIEDSMNKSIKNIHSSLVLEYSTFIHYYKLLVRYSKDHALSLIRRTITIVNETVDKKKYSKMRKNEKNRINNLNYLTKIEHESIENSEISDLRDGVIQFLLQTQVDIVD